jgi:N-glycosylase/DNA lyase
VRNSAFAGIDGLRSEFASYAPAIRARLHEFAAVPRQEFFYELGYCLLTPQSSALHAERAIAALREAACFDNPGRIAEILRLKKHYIRFHNTKARRLTAAWAQLPEIMTFLESGFSAPELRRLLVARVRGLGWKEASHFLRNIGYRNLAILDRHILRNLVRHRAILSMPGTLTPARYLMIESRFARLAAAAGITMDELDLLFWKRETGFILK